jgi:hypothetical protein
VPLLDDMAAYLASATSAFIPMSGTAGNMLKSAMLDHTPAPDTMISLYETGGMGPSWAFGSTAPVYETAGLQVLARSTSYATAHALAHSAYVWFGGLRNKYLPSTTATTKVLYVDVQPDQPPFSIGPDANGRHLVSVNFTVRKERHD